MLAIIKIKKEDEDSLESLGKATFSSLHVSYVASMIKHMFFRSIHFRRKVKGEEMMLWRCCKRNCVLKQTNVLPELHCFLSANLMENSLHFYIFCHEDDDDGHVTRASSRK